jgi:hypothetical protein
MANENLWIDLEEKIETLEPDFTPENVANKSTNSALGASDTAYPSQKAVRDHVAARVLQGSGSPETVVTAPVGTMFLRTDGGALTTLYVKESGAGNTSWIAK